MFKKTLSLLLAVIVFAAFIPAAYADPTTEVAFNNAPVHGGSSQELCINKTCTDTGYCNYQIDYLNLNGQSKMSFRPYKGDTPLSTSPANVTNTTAVLYLYYNNHHPALGNKLKLKASIPSTNTSIYAYFSGNFWF